MTSIEDTDPYLYTNGTASEIVRCRYTPKGCRRFVQFWAGGYRTVRAEMDAHEIACVFRYFPDP